MKSTTELNYEDMARVQGVREKTLMQRVRRGSFPAPDTGTPRNQKWSRSLIASEEFSGHLPAGTIIPPHWRSGTEITKFIGTRSVRGSRGQSCALLIFDVGGTRTGILFTPDFHFDEVFRLKDAHTNFLDCDIIYQPDEMIDFFGMPEMAYDVRPSGRVVDCLDDRRQANSGTWRDLSKVMNIPLPFWPIQLRQMSDILAWTPERSQPNPVALVPVDDRWERLSVIEPFVEGEYKPVVEAKKEHCLREFHGDSDSIMGFITSPHRDADPKFFTIPVVAQPFFEMTDDEIRLADFDPGQIVLRDDAPADSRYIVSAATSIIENSRFGRPAFSADIKQDVSPRRLRSRDRLIEWMLTSPTEDFSDTMTSTLLGIAHGGKDTTWSRIEGSNGYILRKNLPYAEGVADASAPMVIAPTRISGLGRVEEFTLPEDPTGLTLFSDDRGRVWPVPVRDYELSSGYPGGGPSTFAQIVLRLLTHDGDIDLDDDDIELARLTDPDSGREFTAYASPNNTELAPFAGATRLDEVFTRDMAIREFVRTGDFV